MSKVNRSKSPWQSSHGKIGTQSGRAASKTPNPRGLSKTGPHRDELNQAADDIERFLSRDKRKK
jgi:hypothetical protein